MPQSDKINRYLKTVCEQIRWKKAHDIISEEIENHITDQINAFIADGLDEETATDVAIKEMGDPVLVGSELDRAYKPKIEWSIVALTAGILLIGFAVRTFITYDTETALIPINSIISTVLGIGCMTAAYFVDFTIIGRYSKIIYLCFIAAMIGVMTVFPAVNGQYFYAQFILLLFPTAFAGIVYSMRNKGSLGIILCGLFFALPGFIGLIIPSISTMVLCSITCLTLLTIAIAKGWFNIKKSTAMLLAYLPVIIIAAAVFFGEVFNSPYMLRRMQVAVNPSLDPMGTGYVGTMIRNVTANAKFLGQGGPAAGPGSSLPNINTDLIFTYLIHRIGWVSFIAITTLILTFIVRSFALCFKQKSVLAILVSTSVIITFTMEVFLYAAYNLGFTLFSPLTLPLISYSGISSVINMLLIGIMLSVYKSGRLIRDNIAASPAPN